MSPLSQLGGPRVGSREQALATLERLSIGHLALEHLDRLSGGQRQFASLAQAVSRKPRVLLLDEPTSALDLRHQVRVMNLVRELAREGWVVVVVLHDLNLAARWADHVVVLHDGTSAGEGTPAETITAPMLAHVYGIEANVELSSVGRLQIGVEGLADTAAAEFSLPKRM